MSISKIATVIFFGVYGISHFVPFTGAGLILGVAALVVAIALLANK